LKQQTLSIRQNAVNTIRSHAKEITIPTSLRLPQNPGFWDKHLNTMSMGWILTVLWCRRGSRLGGGGAPPEKGLAWLDWQSLDGIYVILTPCSFDSSLHCNEYSYMSLLPRSGSCKNRHQLHFTFCNHGCWIWWTTSKTSESSKAAWFFLQ